MSQRRALPPKTPVPPPPEEEEEKSRWGTIALLTVIAIVAIAFLAYKFIPAFHSSVNSIGAKIKGNSAKPAPPPKAKAQLFWGRDQVEKDQVKAAGVIQNISEEDLSQVKVEVNLLPIGASESETRVVAVIPEALTPGQQGQFTIEYNGKMYMGYKIIKLTQKDGEELKFKMPGQQK